MPGQTVPAPRATRQTAGFQRHWPDDHGSGFARLDGVDDRPPPAPGSASPDSARSSVACLRSLVLQLEARGLGSGRRLRRRILQRQRVKNVVQTLVQVSRWKGWGGRPATAQTERISAEKLRSLHFLPERQLAEGRKRKAEASPRDQPTLQLTTTHKVTNPSKIGMNRLFFFWEGAIWRVRGWCATPIRGRRRSASATPAVGQPTPSGPVRVGRVPSTRRHPAPDRRPRTPGATARRKHRRWQSETSPCGQSLQGISTIAWTRYRRPPTTTSPGRTIPAGDFYHRLDVLSASLNNNEHGSHNPCRGFTPSPGMNIGVPQQQRARVAQSLQGISTIAWGCQSAAPATPGCRPPHSAQLCRSCLPGTGRGPLQRRGLVEHHKQTIGKVGNRTDDSSS